jgi:hypothetical protein
MKTRSWILMTKLSNASLFCIFTVVNNNLKGHLEGLKYQITTDFNLY